MSQARVCGRETGPKRPFFVEAHAGNILRITLFLEGAPQGEPDKPEPICCYAGKIPDPETHPFPFSVSLRATNSITDRYVISDHLLFDSFETVKMV